MNLEQHVCSIELALRLKALGMGQTSLCYWYQNEGIKPRVTMTLTQHSQRHAPQDIAAFTVSELGEMLPPTIRFKNQGHLWIRKLRTAWQAGYLSDDHTWETCAQSDTEADALAKLLIWLIENGHVSVEELE